MNYHDGLFEDLKRKEHRERRLRRKKIREPESDRPKPILKHILIVLVTSVLGVLGYEIVVYTRKPEPSAATAECRDGTYSYSAHRSGTCSGRGGVKRWINLPEY